MGRKKIFDGNFTTRLSSDKELQNRLIKQHYLHTYSRNFKLVENSSYDEQDWNPMTKEDIKELNKLWKQVITWQREAEDKFLEECGCKDERELNERIVEQEGDDAFVEVKTKDGMQRVQFDYYAIFEEAIKTTEDTKSTVTWNRSVAENIAAILLQQINEKTNIDFFDKDGNLTYEGSLLSEGINKSVEGIANRTKYDKKTKKDKKVYKKWTTKDSATMKKKIVSTIQTYTGEIPTMYYLNGLKNLGGKGNVIFRATGRELTSNSKQIKADNIGTVKFTGKPLKWKYGKDGKGRDVKSLNYGIQIKNYTLDLKKDGGASVNMSIDSASSLHEFYNNLKTGISDNKYGSNAAFVSKIKQIVGKMEKSDTFIYKLINEAALRHEEFNSQDGASIYTNREATAAYALKNFVDKLVPYFMGSGVLKTVQQKTKGDNGVYFYIIQDQVVRSSDILASLMGKANTSASRIKSASLNVKLYTNYKYDEAEFLDKKIRASSGDDMYSQGFVDVGVEYGETVYKKIAVGTKHLNLTLKDLITK